MVMTEKPTYEELLRRLNELEQAESARQKTEKQAKTALRQSEVHLRTLINTIPDLIWLKDLQGVYLSCNRMFEQFFGATEAEIVGKTDYDFKDKELADFFRAHDQKAIEAGGPSVNEEWLTFSGMDYYGLFETIKTPMYDESGHVIGVLGIARDITARKKAEDALKENEARYKKAQRMGQVGNWEYEITTDRFWGSDQAKRLYGFDPESRNFTTDEVESCIPERERVHQALVDLIEKNTPYNIEFEIQPADGAGRRILHSVAEVISDGAGMPLKVAGVVQDITALKMAEKTLRESEALLNRSQEIASMGSFTWELRTDSLAWSRNMYAIHGIDEDTFDGNLTEVSNRLVHPDDRDRVQMEIAEMIAAGRVVNMEFRIVRPDGEERIMRSSGEFELDDAGHPAICYGIHQDITENKRFEEELKKRELTLNKIFDVLPIGLWFTDKNGTLIKGNPAGVKIWGAEPTVPMEEYGVFKARRLPSGEEIAPDDWALTHTIKTGTTITDELLEIDAFDGRKKIILNYTAPVVDDAGGMLGAIVVNNDITDRWRAEEKYRRITENMSDVVWIMDLDMRLSYVSPSVEKMVGEPVAAHMSRTLEERLTPESMEKIYAIFTEELEKENDPSADKNRSRVIEVEHFRADGSKFWVSVNASFIRDNNGTPIAIQGVTRDITERKEAENEQRKLQDQLAQAQKMESVGRLAGGVAHDFNNMLSVILGHAELALDELGPDHPVYDDLTEIEGAGRRSAALVRQLLAFARKQTIVPQILDLNDTVEGMLKMLRRLIGENINLAWQPGHQLWPVRMDPSQIDQVLANLCVNARDAIDGVGEITIETQNVIISREQMDQYSFLVPGDYVLLAVTDDGCGMDPETLSHLFEPFFTTKDVGKGTGLGLATIYGIVKQNRGFITADSAPGQGTTFKMYLPCHKAAAPINEDPAASVPQAGNHETVLLVEDEPSILKMGKNFLERLGYRVFTAATPDDAVRLAREYTGDIHLLMTDVIMPGMNGRDLAVQVAAIYPHIKCLYMSGYTADIIAHHGVLEDGVAFIQKPFSRAELAVKVRAALSQ